MVAPQSPKILIIGAGMSGILVAMRLLNAGFTDFRIYEKDEDLGGTWRINTIRALPVMCRRIITHIKMSQMARGARLPQGAEIPTICNRSPRNMIFANISPSIRRSCAASMTEKSGRSKWPMAKPSCMIM